MVVSLLLCWNLVSPSYVCSIDVHPYSTEMWYCRADHGYVVSFSSVNIYARITLSNITHFKVTKFQLSRHLLKYRMQQSMTVPLLSPVCGSGVRVAQIYTAVCFINDLCACEIGVNCSYFQCTSDSSVVIPTCMQHYISDYFYNFSSANEASAWRETGGGEFVCFSS